MVMIKVSWRPLLPLDTYSVKGKQFVYSVSTMYIGSVLVYDPGNFVGSEGGPWHCIWGSGYKREELYNSITGPRTDRP